MNKENLTYPNSINQWQFKLHRDYGGRFTGRWVITDDRDFWIVALVEEPGPAHLMVEAPEMYRALEDARDRLLTALKYGPDMASSRELCIHDALGRIVKILSKIDERKV